MNVSLTPRLDQFVAAQVADGRYRSASEVVREGLRLLEIRDGQLTELRAAIEAGMSSPLAAGDQAMQRIRKKLAAQHGCHEGEDFHA